MRNIAFILLVMLITILSLIALGLFVLSPWLIFQNTVGLIGSCCMAFLCISVIAVYLIGRED